MAIPQYDLFLGQPTSLKGYRLRSITRDTAPALVPRFSTSNEGQTDLDLVKVGQLQDVEAGMFQREWEDDHKAFWVQGLYNPVTRKLHPNVPRATTSGYTTTNVNGHSFTAKVSGYGTIFWAERRFSSNVLFKMDSTGAISSVTLPVAISGSGCKITGLSLHKNYLIVNGMESGSTSFNTHRMDLATSSFQDLGGSFNKTATLNGVLYGIQSESIFYLITNETIAGSATFTQLKIFGIGSSAISPILSFYEYNGALYFGKYEGLYRFDGVDARRVIDLRCYYNIVWNGRTYFMAEGWLYSFDGGVLTRLQFFGTAHNIVDLSVWQDRLVLLSTPNYTDIVADGYNDGFALSTSNRIFGYDGVGFTILDDYYGALALPMGMICGVETLLLAVTLGAPLNTNTSFKYDITAKFKKAQTNVDTFGIVTSEFDAGYPDVYKSFEAIQLEVFDMGASDNINVEYSLDGGTYVTAGVLTSADKTYIELHNVKFKKVRVRVRMNLAVNSYCTVRSVSIGHTIQPRYRQRWNIEIPLYADGVFSALEERLGSASLLDVNEMVKNLDSVVQSQVHSYFLPVDYGEIKTTVNSSALSFIVKGQFLMNDPPSLYTSIEELPHIAVLNANGVYEIMRVSDVAYNSGTDETTITVVSRGYLGITNASLSAGNQVRLCYKVFVNRLVRDNTILDAEHYNQQTTGESQTQRQYQLELIEV